MTANRVSQITPLQNDVYIMCQCHVTGHRRGHYVTMYPSTQNHPHSKVYLTHSTFEISTIQNRNFPNQIPNT